LVAVKAPAYFRRKLKRVIEPAEGPGVELATLEDCAKFMPHMRRWRHGPIGTVPLSWCSKAAKTGRRLDVDAAGAQMEQALRCDGWP
jgi:hypothetical protein